jgi:putative spermidine/putrescine transport system permease protein
VKNGAALAIPGTLLAGTVVAGGLGFAIAQSLGFFPILQGTPRGLTAYRQLATDPALPSSLGLSITIAAVSALLAAMIGFTTAALIQESRRHRRYILGAAAATLPVPHLIGAAAISLLLSDSGVLARLTHAAQGTWPQFVAGRWWLAVIIEYVWKESAFIALVVFGAFAVDIRELTESAAVLGAGWFSRLRYVTLPQARSALIVSTTIGFVYVLSSYEVPWLLGRSYPQSMPVLSFELFTSNDLTQRPQAYAAAMITALICGLAGMAMVIGLRRRAAAR